MTEVDHVLPSCYIMAASVGDLKGYDHQFVEPPVERCSVRDVWRNTRRIQQSVPSVEKISTILLIKEVSIPSGEQLYGTYIHIFIIIPQVRDTSFHLKFTVTIHLVAVSGLESYTHWTSTWLAVTSHSCHALMNAMTGLKWSSYSVNTWRSTQRGSVQDASTSVLTARRLGSIEI